MNLAWLAAVLEPSDVAPHPNFPDQDYDSSGPARLANVVLGNPQSRRSGSIEESDEDDPVALAEQCLRFDTMAISVRALAARLTNYRPEDPAQALALGLIVCSAAAEMDDYDTCFKVLDAQLGWASSIAGSDEALLRAALLQQKALRLQDAGQAYLATTTEVARALSALDAKRCSSFRTSPGVSWSSLTTVERIRESLVAAAASLLPFDQPHLAESIGLPTWQQRIRGLPPSIVVSTARRRAEIYADYIEQEFGSKFKSGTRSITTPSRPDLFYSLLALELVGHGGVYGVRKELALLRLVQANGQPSDMADALRSLRHAASRNELELALSRIRAGGPLSVLSDDARQILRTRLEPNRLRTVELHVLQIASDVLAPAEASVALDAVLRTLSTGGPPDLPGHWELPVLRKEAAWVAAAALSNISGESNKVAELLAKEAAKVQEDDSLLDRALLRATAELHWPTVGEGAKDSWVELLTTHGTLIPGTAEMVLGRLGRPALAPVPASAMDSLRYRLNIAIGGGTPDPALGEDDVSLILRELAGIREDAAHGRYSFGSFMAADMAAGLLVNGGRENLWPELSEFLLDNVVPRQDRTSAFERLTRANVALPETVRSRFQERAEILLTAVSPILFETNLNPYPAALRFLAAYGLLEETQVYDEIASLAGATNVDGRREAAATVAALAARSPRSDLLVLALPLSRDDGVEVRAYAARALALLAGLDQPLAAVARRRLQQLLLEDGILIPLSILRALTDVPKDLRNSVSQQLTDIAELHPARSIREEARKLLAN